MHQMKASVLLLLLLALSQLLSYTGVQGLTWNDNVGADLRTCVGEQFQFEWRYTLDNTEMELSKNWTAVLNGRTVWLMLERPTEFQFEQNGGLTLRSASLAHSGNYSLTVDVMVNTTTGNMERMKYERSANLTVAEPPRTNGRLQVAQDRKAIYDNHTSMWHVTLSCGQFVSLGHPAVDVVWQTPSGRKSSSKYQDGRFYLQLPNPVEGGEYSCILPSTDPATSCLPDGSLLETALVVDETNVRLTLLEAENTVMKAAVKDLKAENKDLKAENTDMKAAVKDLKAENKDLKAENKDIKTLVNNNAAALKTATRRVAFHARLSGDRRVNYFNPVILDTVMLNEGGAYSGTTGRFTVPYTGTYFLIATTAHISTPSSDYLFMRMMADGQWLCYAYSKYANHHETTTCHVTVHLREGQRVWLQSLRNNAYFHSSFTAFSGFLLHADE